MCVFLLFQGDILCILKRNNFFYIFNSAWTNIESMMLLLLGFLCLFGELFLVDTFAITQP